MSVVDRLETRILVTGAYSYIRQIKQLAKSLTDFGGVSDSVSNKLFGVSKQLQNMQHLSQKPVIPSSISKPKLDYYAVDALLSSKKAEDVAKGNQMLNAYEASQRAAKTPSFAVGSTGANLKTKVEEQRDHLSKLNNSIYLTRSNMFDLKQEISDLKNATYTHLGQEVLPKGTFMSGSIAARQREFGSARGSLDSLSAQANKAAALETVILDYKTRNLAATQKYAAEMTALQAEKVATCEVAMMSLSGRIETLRTNLAALWQQFKPGIIIGGMIAFATIGKFAIDASLKVDTFRKRLSQVFGGSGEGEQALNWARQFALTGKAELPALVEGMVTLVRLGIQPTARMMEALKDASLETGYSMENVAKAMAYGTQGQWQRMSRGLAIPKATVMRFAEPGAFTGKGINAQVADPKKVQDAIIKVLESPAYKGMAQKMTTGLVGTFRQMGRYIYDQLISLGDMIIPVMTKIFSNIFSIVKYVAPIFLVGFKIMVSAINLIVDVMNKFKPEIKAVVMGLTTLAAIFAIQKTALAFARGLLWLSDIVLTLVGSVMKLNLVETISNAIQWGKNMLTSAQTAWTGIALLVKALWSLKVAAIAEAWAMLVASAAMNPWLAAAKLAAVIAIAAAATYALSKGFDVLSKSQGKTVSELPKMKTGLTQLTEGITATEKKIKDLKQTMYDFVSNTADKIGDFREIMESMGVVGRPIQEMYALEAQERKKSMDLATAEMERIKKNAKSNFTYDMFGFVNPSSIENYKSSPVQKPEEKINVGGLRDTKEYLTRYNEVQYFKHKIDDTYANMNKRRNWTHITSDSLVQDLKNYQKYYAISKEKLNDLKKSGKQYEPWSRVRDNPAFANYKQATADLGVQAAKQAKEINDENDKRLKAEKAIFDFRSKMLEGRKFEERLLGGMSLKDFGFKQGDVWKKYGTKMYQAFTNPNINIKVNVTGEKGLTGFVENIATALWNERIKQLAPVLGELVKTNGIR
jgi:hypothetical protein